MTSKDKILVTGGAGYIGSQVALDLQRSGFEPIIIDNYVTGNKAIIEKLNISIFDGCVGDEIFLKSIFAKHNFRAVMHFAAYTQVGESVLDPAKYYQNNVGASLVLLKVMKEAGVKDIIFSSTAAVYGIPETTPISETAPLKPINPYGWSKLFVERILEDYCAAFGFRAVIFRYFNAAGADSSSLIGEQHNPETHLIPLTIFAAAKGTPIKVFGNDYATSDGTCIRDYVHVADISQAHLLGLKKLITGFKWGIFNIGSGGGYSVLDVIKSVEEVIGKKIIQDLVTRRAGDPARLVASSDRLLNDLGWLPKYRNLSEIVDSAWKWHKKQDI
ncbi:MAG: UDP-glucose 4-epimerase GalE [bacterium]|nr:UDP-glucose 4-epimerase GalE [bacterium]